MTMPDNVDNHAAKLARIRRDRRRCYLLLFLTPVAALLTEINADPGRVNIQAALTGIIIVGFGGAFVLGMKYTWSRCPRCGNLFFMKGIFMGNAFARKCMHCGLPLAR